MAYSICRYNGDTPNESANALTSKLPGVAVTERSFGRVELLTFWLLQTQRFAGSEFADFSVSINYWNK